MLDHLNDRNSFSLLQLLTKFCWLMAPGGLNVDLDLLFEHVEYLCIKINQHLLADVHFLKDHSTDT